MAEQRWRLIGGPLGRVYVDGGPEPSPLDVGETLTAVPEAEVERLREALAEIDAALTTWRESPTPPATNLRALMDRIREIDEPLAGAHDRLRAALDSGSRPDHA